MIRRFLAALLPAAVLSIAGCPGRDGQAAEHPELASGDQLYTTYCALCHGDEGQGYVADNAPSLRNQDFLASASEGFLREAIKHGRPGTSMAAYASTAGGPLDSEAIDRLVRFIRGWRREPFADLTPPGGGDSARAEPLFAEKCASCHGDAGEGRTALTLNNPRFLATASDAFIRHAIVQGRRETDMQAFGEELSDQQVADLVALIRSWARPVEDTTARLPEQQREVVINPRGTHPRFELREERFVSVDQVHAALEAGQRIVLLDARPTSDWLQGHIPGAVYAPYYHLGEVVPRLPRDGTWIVAYCGCPHAASGHVIDDLRDRGFARTAVLDEGIFVWAERGYPMTAPLPTEDEEEEGE